MEGINDFNINNMLLFENVKDNAIEEFKENLESLKHENYKLWVNNEINDNETIINLYKDIFTYLFFSTYDKNILMFRNSDQYIGSSFIMKYFKIINGELYYIFDNNRYIIIDSGYNLLENSNEYEIEIKLNKEFNYLWDLKPIIKNNRLYYFIKYIGFIEKENKNLISLSDIQNMIINIYSKNLIDKNNILKKENS